MHKLQLCEYTTQAMVLEPEHMLSFVDTMQAVPHLLTSCASVNGVKELRLVCQPARSMALKAIRSYRLKLAHEPSATEPLLAAATLLKETQLKRLYVQVTIPKYGTC